MQSELVSVITPSYKSERFIAECIESVLAQTYENWEMIIVDDCSPDNSNAIIQEYLLKDSRIKFFQLEKNSGAAEARNRAIAEAKGRYIAFLDADDVWMQGKLTKQLHFMQKHGYAFTFTAYSAMSEDAKEELYCVHVPKKLTYSDYCKNTIIGCLTVVIDRSIVGDFRMPNIKSSHDMALWLLLLKRGFTAYGMDVVLAKYRVVANSNTAKKYKAAADVWRVYREIEKLGIFRSSWYFVHYAYNALRKRM